jgi:hypothetical protein
VDLGSYSIGPPSDSSGDQFRLHGVGFGVNLSCGTGQYCGRRGKRGIDGAKVRLCVRVCSTPLVGDRAIQRSSDDARPA